VLKNSLSHMSYFAGGPRHLCPTPLEGYANLTLLPEQASLIFMPRPCAVCDFDVPTEQPSMLAISSCSWPSMSWRREDVGDKPGGNCENSFIQREFRSTIGMAIGIFSVPLTIWIGGFTVVGRLFHGAPRVLRKWH